MKKLIIVANPNPKSFTYTLLGRYQELSESNGDTVEVFDLYNTPLKQDFLRFEDRKEVGKDNTTRQIQEKIMAADELVFIFPIWWGDAPAILKNFLDSNFGFAFQHINEKPLQVLRGKTARIIATSGAPSLFYTLFLHIQLFWNFNRIGYCNIKQKSFTVFGNIENEKTDREKYLKKLEKLV